MPITEAQRETRKRFLGSSDAAAVVGLDHYRTPFDVWADKTGRILPSGLEPNNDAIDIGNYLEAGVLNWFASKRGLKLVLNDEADRNRRQHDNGIMAANVDAFVEDDPTQIVEAKTTGVVSMRVPETWGEVGTDEVPDRVKLQVMHQMAVVPAARVAWVPVLMGGVGLRHYRIERDDDLIRNLTDIELAFWNDHVLKDVPPEGEASLETLKKLRREPNKITTISDEAVAKWLRAKEAFKLAEDAKKEAELLVLKCLGDAEAGDYAAGRVTYFLSKPRASYVVPAHPGFRSLRVSKTKA